MEHREKIKLDDFKAHYAVIVGEIDVANAELGKILKEKKLEEGNYAALLLLISEATKEYEQLLRDGEQARKRNLEERVLLESSINNHNKDKQTFSDYRDSEESRLLGLKKVTELEVRDAKEELASIQGKVVTLNATAVSLSKEKTDLLRDKKQIEKDISTVRQSHQDFVINADSEQATLSKKIVETKSLLSKLEKKLTDDRKNANGPLALIEERNLAVAKRERDFEIMYQRLSAVFQKMNPGQKLII